MRVWGCIAVACLLMACGTEDGSEMLATLADHPDALSASGADRLFNCEISQSDAAYSLDSLMLTFKPVGGTATALNYELTDDLNGDGMLGEGDTLTGIEPGLNILGPSQAGSDFTVELMEQLGPAQVSGLWNGMWHAE